MTTAIAPETTVEANETDLYFVWSDSELTTTRKINGVKYTAAVKVEVPRTRTNEFFLKFAGGPDNALAFVNGAIETNAKNGGRVDLRDSINAIPEEALVLDHENKTITVSPEIMKSVQATTRGYRPSQGREPGKAKRQDQAIGNVRALLESGADFTKEQILAMLEAAR